MVEELYDLEADVGETTNRHAEQPEVVAELQARAERARAELGDARLGITGSAAAPRPGRPSGDPHHLRPGPPVLPGRVRPPDRG